MTLPDLFHFLLQLGTRYLSPEAIAAEWLMVLLVAFVFMPALRRLPLTALCDTFRRVARNRRLALALCFGLPIAIRLALLGVIPVPWPSIHDEFSHLLLGDTLAHFRLANPAHPLWRHFESIHILQQPTYASMYPPAQGAFLAIGQLLFHQPWAGVVLSVGLMCAVLCWMLQAWMPPEWALFGTVIVFLKIGLTGLWINSYLGGSPSAIGAALVLGSAGRRRYPLLFGAGLVMLMNSRPFEGAFLGLCALIYLFTQRALPRSFLLRAGSVVALGVLAAGFYNFRVTGNPLRLPYVLNRDTYGWPENLGFLPPKKLAPLPDPDMEAMRQRELNNRAIYRDPKLIIENLDTKIFDSWVYFLGPLLTVPLLFFRPRRSPALFWILAVLLSVNLFQMVLYPYHLGHAVPLIFALVALGVRQVYTMCAARSPAWAHAFAVSLPLGLILIGTMKEFAPELRLPLTYWENCREPHQQARASIEHWLAQQPGGQLVIVRYALDHNPTQEWIYNAAQIDRSKVIWARELPDNQQLFSYYPNRAKWLLRADEYPARVVPYP